MYTTRAQQFLVRAAGGGRWTAGGGAVGWWTMDDERRTMDGGRWTAGGWMVDDGRRADGQWAVTVDGGRKGGNGDGGVVGR